MPKEYVSSGAIKSKPATPKYRDNWDDIFMKKEKPPVKEALKRRVGGIKKSS